MKLYALLSSLLLLGNVACTPCLLGLGLAAKVIGRSLTGVRGGGSVVGGLVSRTATKVNQPAPKPIINVNVENVYTNQNNNILRKNTNIDSLQNNVVSNNVNVNQKLDNRVDNNAYTTNRLSNIVTNNGAGYSQGESQSAGYQEDGYSQESGQSSAAQLGGYSGYSGGSQGQSSAAAQESSARYAAADQNCQSGQATGGYNSGGGRFFGAAGAEQEQSYRNKDSIKAEKEQEYSSKAKAGAAYYGQY